MEKTAKGEGESPRSLAGSLKYLFFTRPDISYAVQQIYLYMHDPRDPCFSALKRILRYVRGTLNYGLQLFSSSTTYLVAYLELDYGLQLFSSSTTYLDAYSDADWAGCPTSRRSTSEVDYHGVANVVAETCLLRNLLRSCRCTTLLGAKCRRSGRRVSWQRLGPSLTCVPTCNPIAGHKSMRASSSICKRSTMARRFLSRKGPNEDGTYDVERIKRERPLHISEVDWDARISFWNDPKNLARAAQNKQNRTKSKASSATREYPSLNHTFFLTHTVGGVFVNPEDKALYDEMLRLQGLGFNTPSGVPYTDDEIMVIVRGGKQRGHIPGVGRVFSGQGTIIPPQPPCMHSSDVAKLKMSEKLLTKQGGGSGSGGCGDDELGDDEDDDEDGKDEDDN
nr:ribonuclease H-like domain-containing protein [Tanacetum cinerariifolium]